MNSFTRNVHYVAIMIDQSASQALWQLSFWRSKQAITQIIRGVYPSLLEAALVGYP
jgi:hypothetical protein